MQTSAPSVAEMLRQGRTVMAMATLLYGPGPVSQVRTATRNSNSLLEFFIHITKLEDDSGAGR